jgi:hypothetical protein
MKRRRRKRKTEQGGRPADQVMVQSGTEQPASPVDVQGELENLASPTDLRNETESHPIPVVESADTEERVPNSMARTGADRRTHPRYAFTAVVEVVTDESGARLKTRVRDLSQQGCYVDTESPFALGTVTQVRITKNVEAFEAHARVVYNQPGKGMGLMFTAVESEPLGILNTWITESRELSWLAANRRRSNRILMEIPVRVSGEVGTLSFFEEHTHTLTISAHGALIVVTAPVYRGQRVTLSNIQTNASLECLVAHIKKVPGGQTQVGVEFVLPNPTFWHVAFPPKNWTPRHPDAKSG